MPKQHARPAQDVRARRPRRTKCLTCQAAAKVRGLCATCRSAAWRAVVSGSASEEELIARGLLLPAKTPGRPAKSGFARRLAQLKK